MWRSNKERKKKNICTYILCFFKERYYEWTADPLVDQAAQPGFLKFPRQKSPQPARCVVTRREERCAEMVRWFCRGPQYAARLQRAGRRRWKGQGFRAKVGTSHTFLLVSHLDVISHTQWPSGMADRRHLYWRKLNWNMGHCVSPLSSASPSHFLSSSCGWCAQTLSELQTRLPAATVTTLWCHRCHLEPTVANRKRYIYIFLKTLYHTNINPLKENPKLM